MRVLKRLAIVLLSILLSFLLLAGVAQALISLDILNIRNILGVAGAELPRDENGFTNLLLLGKGDDDHDGVDLTDTMMIASIDPKTESTVLLSIPRDLYVTSEKMGQGRINELYRNYKVMLRRKDISKEEASHAALLELMREVGRKTGISLHHAVMVNFTGFVQAVDALGGIDVTVPYDIVDREYPGPNWTYQTFAINAGPAHLDGETALKYARSRHTTSDFGRSARQQQVIAAVGEKAKTLGIVKSPGKILALLRILSQNVETTMSTAELLGAAKLGEELDRTRIVSMQITDRSGYQGGLPEAGGFLYDPPRDQFAGASILLPAPTPPSDPWKQIRTFARLLLTARTMYLSQPRIAILNAGGKTGAAGLLAAELTRYGFMVERAENAFPRTEKNAPKLETTTVFAPAEADRPAASFFASLLGLPLAENPPPLPVAPEKLDQVTILLGKDFTLTPLYQRVTEPGSSSSSSL